MHYKIDEIINEIESHGLIKEDEKKGYLSYIYNYILQYIKLFKDKFLKSFITTMCIGYIYSIRLINNHQKQYIGSTVQPISTRLSKHVVHDYKRYIDDRCNNVSSFEIIMNGNYEIVQLEKSILILRTN